MMKTHEAQVEARKKQDQLSNFKKASIECDASPTGDENLRFNLL